MTPDPLSRGQGVDIKRLAGMPGRDLTPPDGGNYSIDEAGFGLLFRLPGEDDPPLKFGSY